VPKLLDFVRGVLSNLKAAYLKAKPTQQADLLDALFEKVTLETEKFEPTQGGFFQLLAGQFGKPQKCGVPDGIRRE
jgi:hypothetical protein